MPQDAVASEGNEVLVAGHLCVDLTPGLTANPEVVPGQLIEVGALTTSAGGCVGGTATPLARLGTRVRLAADIGDDVLGRTLRSNLNQVGDISLVVARPGTATSYTIVIDPPGMDRSFWHHGGANDGFDGGAIGEADLASADLIHVGYPTLLPKLTANDGAALISLFERAHQNDCLTSLDLSVVAESSGTNADWHRLLELVLPHTDFLSPSIDDLRSILGSSFETSAEGLGRAGEQMIELGATIVLVTGGANGMALRSADEQRLRQGATRLRSVAKSWADCALHLPAPDVEVRRTTGAGDASSAGLLHGFLSGLDPAEALACATEAAATVIGHDHSTA